MASELVDVAGGPDARPILFLRSASSLRCWGEHLSGEWTLPRLPKETGFDLHGDNKTA